MKKLLFTITILFINIIGFSQITGSGKTQILTNSEIVSLAPGNYKSKECSGYWTSGDTSYFTDWVTLDTLGKKKIKTNKRKWILDKEKLDDNGGRVLLIYEPCGSARATYYTQLRICNITGIRQTRQHIYPKKWVAYPKTDYEKALDKFLVE